MEEEETLDSDGRLGEDEAREDITELAARSDGRGRDTGQDEAVEEITGVQKRRARTEVRERERGV